MTRTNVTMAGRDGVLGCDVSKWQGGINYGVFGLDFVVYKASGGDGGGLYEDGYFDRNAAGFQSVEGPYHFAGARDPIQEAEFYLRTILNSAWADLPAGQRLPPTLDWEPTFHVDNSALWCRRFMEHVNERVNMQSWIYSAGWCGPAGSPGDMAWLRSQPFWLACYASNPDYYPCAPWGTDWVAWQFTSTGHNAGISGNCDTNIMRRDVFDAVTRGAAADVPSIPSAPPPVLPLEEDMPIVRHFIEPGTNEPKDMYILAPDKDAPHGFGWIHLDSPQTVGDGVHAGTIASDPSVILPSNDQNENALWERYAVLSGPHTRGPVG